MPICEACGNDYAGTFTIVMAEATHTFDCFECAIATLAPVCDRCGCRVIGHGVQANDVIYCGAHCARTVGVQGLRDHIWVD